MAAGAGLDTMAGESLLERDVELAALTELVAAAADGHGSPALVESAAGLGKTALLGAAGRLAGERGLRVLAARAALLERDFAFGVARQLFEPLVRGRDESLFAGAAALARPLLLEGEQPLAAGDADTIFRALHGLYWLLVNATEQRPVALLIDDLHWADEPSLRFVAFMRRRVEGLPALMLCASRPLAEVGDGGTLAQLLGDAGLPRLTPSALSQSGVAALVATRTGRTPEPAFAAACAQVTGGNPFHVVQLVSALERSGVVPNDVSAESVRRLHDVPVSRAVLAHLGVLSADCRALARAVSVAGDGVQRPVAAALAGLDDAAAARAADELVRASIVETDLRLSFVHPIVREAVYADIAPHARADLHLAAARLLHAAGAPHELLAAHLLATTPAHDAWRVAVLRAAAGAALARGAPDVAATYMRAALAAAAGDELRAELALAAGKAEALAGDPRCLAHLEAATAGARPVVRADAALVLGRVLSVAGRRADAVALLRRVADDVRDAEPERAALLDAALFATVLILGDHRVDDVARRLKQMALARRTEGDHLALGLLAAWAMVRDHPAAEWGAQASDAWDGGRLVGRVEVVPEITTLVACVLGWSGRAGEAQAAFAAILADARERGSISTFALASQWRSELMMACGRPADAEADALEAVRRAARLGLGLILPSAAALLVDALVARGALDEADEALRANGLSAGAPDGLPGHMLLFHRGRLRLAQGDAAAAVADLEECGGRRERLGVGAPALLPWRADLAIALRAAGRRDEARAVAAEGLARARAVNEARAIGTMLHARGLVEEGDTQIDLLTEAVTVLLDSPWRPALARAHVALGAALRRANRRVESRMPLTQGLRLAQDCGLTPLAEHAATELAASGARLKRALRRGLDELTPSERRTAGMAASGLSNKEIAQALFVTRKTVEAQLSACYRKLGITSRQELAPLFREATAAAA